MAATDEETLLSEPFSQQMLPSSAMRPGVKLAAIATGMLLVGVAFSGALTKAGTVEAMAQPPQWQKLVIGAVDSPYKLLSEQCDAKLDARGVEFKKAYDEYSRCKWKDAKNCTDREELHQRANEEETKYRNFKAGKCVDESVMLCNITGDGGDWKDNTCMPKVCKPKNIMLSILDLDLNGTVSCEGHEVMNRERALLAEEIDALDDECKELPFVKLEKVISSNLGKQGPDKDAPEGIIYQATAINMGLSTGLCWYQHSKPHLRHCRDVTNLQIHVHSLQNFSVADDDEDSYDATYVPAFKTGSYVNGIHGKFACINIKQNTTLKLRAHAYDADNKEDISLPHAAISFFDLDTGYDNNHSVEHVSVAGYSARLQNGYSAYYLSNETEIAVSHDHDIGFTTFTATEEGSGEDNPTNPMDLTKLQKDRAVTLDLTDVKHVDFEIGTSAGRTSRVFSFVFRPSLLCAKTDIHKHLYPATGKKAPIVPVKTNSGSVKGFPSVLVMVGLVSLLAQSFM